MHLPCESYGQIFYMDTSVRLSSHFHEFGGHPDVVSTSPRRRKKRNRLPNMARRTSRYGAVWSGVEVARLLGVQIQVNWNLMLYLPRLTVLVNIVADRPGAWFRGPLGPYLTWFPAFRLSRDLGPVFAGSCCRALVAEDILACD